MNHRVTLTITSLLSIVLVAFHWVDEISRGREAGEGHDRLTVGTLACFAIGRRWGEPLVLPWLS